MDELRLRAVKWSLFHRPLAAARLMAELSALLSSIMYFEKRRALTDNRCGVEHAGAGRLIVERLRRDKRRFSWARDQGLRSETPADLADSWWTYSPDKSGLAEIINDLLKYGWNLKAMQFNSLRSEALQILNRVSECINI